MIMNISEVVKLECCEIDFKATDKKDALHKLAELMKRSREFRNIEEEQIFAALNAREEMGSTGFSKGIAIPHCQLEGLNKFIIAIAVSKKGIHFDSIDKKKSRIFITIIGPVGKRSEHLKLLATVSHILKEPGVIENILGTTTKIGLYEEFLRNANSEDTAISRKGHDKLMILIVKDEQIMQDVTEVFISRNLLSSIPSKWKICSPRFRCSWVFLILPAKKILSVRSFLLKFPKITLMP
jgi:PTS system nitrogen regulatory IIA component